jgi:hypothetical protein
MPFGVSTAVKMEAAENFFRAKLPNSRVNSVLTLPAR